MATSKLQLSFRIFKNNQLVREEVLNQSVIKIGKVASAHLRIDDDSVSRMHAIIEVLGPEVSVIDLGSTGGTFVNGQKVNKAKLQSGDTITVGDTRIEIAMADAVLPTIIVAPTPPPIPVATPMTRTMPAPTAPIAVAIAKPVTPVMFAARATEPSELDQHGAPAVEVATMLGDSVINVKHCMDPRGGKVTGATWAFAACGLACLLASATSFYTSVSTAGRNKSALAAHVAQGKPERAFRPEMMSRAVDGVAFGGLALGLMGVTIALARTRRERKSPYFRIGTAANVEQPIEHAPSPSFPLVAPKGDDFVLNYGAGMDGEMIVDGMSTPLADLAAQGRARPSTTTPGAIEVPLPLAARVRVRAGQTTFLVTGVAKPREQAAPLFNMERRSLGYAAGSLALHLGFVAILWNIQTADAGVSINLESSENLLARSAVSTKEDTVPEPEKETTGENEGEKGAGATMALDEGAAGKPDAVRTDGSLAMKNRNTEPQMSREQAIEEARTAGVLGSVQAIKGGIAALTGTADFSSGFSDADIYGPLIGAQGEGRGNFGFGRKDWGSGGGCTQEPCGIVGTGRYGTIGDGHVPGGGRWDGGKGWGREMKRTTLVPQPTIGMPQATGNLDRAIIKRYIKRHLNMISYCYEKELLARPGIEGTVMVNFLITGTGVVQQSTGNGFDGKVSSCLAGVIKNIEFPRPSDGGSVQVNYPFTFHAAGK
ncbi:MAG: AgmX/PglI C-terminal domain-containing protein [Kofleriaceae bacterium]